MVLRVSYTEQVYCGKVKKGGNRKPSDWEEREMSRIIFLIRQAAMLLVEYCRVGDPESFLASNLDALRTIYVVAVAIRELAVEKLNEAKDSNEDEELEGGDGEGEEGGTKGDNNDISSQRTDGMDINFGDLMPGDAVMRKN